MWHPEHPVGDPSTELGGNGGGLVLTDLGPSVMLRSWALLMISICALKIM